MNFLDDPFYEAASAILADARKSMAQSARDSHELAAESRSLSFPQREEVSV
ncbi:hypothetical protein [Herbidospora galbida]|uniref:hypothetical protein n=1 Tax=Herbidospora galbida TaxID=2575442 RepID=UPI0014854C5F|nr:hypothetical protein [Herbidospora galbida]